MSRVPLRGMCRTIKDGKVARLKISDYELTPISNVRVEAKDLTPDFSLILKRMERTTTNKKKHWHRVHINAGRKWGIGLSLWALGIYIYTIYVMRDERFLDEIPDDFDEITLRK